MAKWSLAQVVHRFLPMKKALARDEPTDSNAGVLGSVAQVQPPYDLTWCLQAQSALWVLWMEMDNEIAEYLGKQFLEEMKTLAPGPSIDVLRAMEA